ncbi:hypothetical protein [Rhizobium rhizogenes]|uniref:hypothetical protein n=1 Tax=Rhizobium rhizogenes TaxID=359 RepID=UPI0024BDCDC1|nr:hypothetical protein [Rhizobium rhizogenes]MDJ1638664.1 hypothetical protein [Rhizobium rhizogenes]
MTDRFDNKEPNLRAAIAAHREAVKAVKIWELEHFRNPRPNLTFIGHLIEVTSREAVTRRRVFDWEPVTLEELRLKIIYRAAFAMVTHSWIFESAGKM